MKKILLFVFLAFAGISYGQTNTEIDQRLIKNHGDNIYQIYEKQKSYYDFLLWELDNGYEIVRLESFDGINLRSIAEVKSKSGVQFDVSVIENTEIFNFISFNFLREKRSSVYYDLGNGTVLKFVSLTEVWNLYRGSLK